MQLFKHKLFQLAKLIEKLEVEWEDQDQLNAIDFENYLFTPKILFAIFTDDEVNLYWQLIDVSSKKENISDKLILCVVDDIDLMIYNAGEFVLIFTKEWNVELTEELIFSLL